MKNNYEIRKNTLIVTTAIEETWGANEELIFLGEWCKRYQAKERWSSRKYETVNFHWQDRKKLNRDHTYLEELYQSMLQSISLDLNKFHNVNYPIRYWRIVIGPWLLSYISIIWDRWEAVQALSKMDSSFATYIFQDIHIDPCGDFSDSISLYQSDLWNHTVFRDILIFCKLPNILLNYIACPDSVKLTNDDGSMNSSVVFNHNPDSSLLKSKCLIERIKSLFERCFFF